MTRHLVSAAGLCFAICLIAASSGGAQSSGPSSGPLSNGGFSADQGGAPGPLSGITSEASGAHPAAKAIDPVYNFGAVYSGAVVKHIFRLKNTGGAPLTIGGVQSSCGCTAAQPTKSHILPGEESDIAVSFDTRGDHGPATRTITVFTNAPKQEQLQLTLRGDVKIQVAANPSLVTFDRVKRGTEQSRQVTLTDEMPDRTLEIGAVKNSNPDIQVVSKPLAHGKPGSLLTITLSSQAPAGPISDLIKVTTSRTTVEIPVSGDVLGDINVSPPQVTFGVVPHHGGALRIVRLTNSGERPVRITGISSNNDSVFAAVEPLKPGREYKITVQLRPNSPDGLLRGRLAIKIDDPHQKDLELPFYGIVGSYRG